MTIKKEIYVFDANFFICMISINARDIISHLKKIASDLNYEFFISSVVFDEIKVIDSFKEDLKNILEIREVDPTKIDQVKKKLDKPKEV